MLSKSCLICSKQSLRQNSQKDSRNTAGGRFSNIPNINGQTVVNENSKVENQLEVIFLLRKLLEIPENTCCLLLQHFGNPNLWIECCDTCSGLVKKCHTAFEQIVSLQQYYEKLRLDIKSTILKSQKTRAIESKCEAIVRSYVITQDVSGFINSYETDTPNEKFKTSARNSKLGNSSEISTNLGEEQQSYLFKTPVLLEQINEVKTEVEDSVPLNVDEEDAEVINSMIEVSEFEESRQSQNECENSNQKYKIEQDGTDENPNSTVESYSYILPDCNFETPSVSDIGPQVETSAQSVINGRHDLTGKKKIRRVRGRRKKQEFECEICGLGFKYSQNLKMHRKSHTGSKKLLKPTSRISGKLFTSIQKLNIHKNNHGGMKSLECDVCGVLFKTSNSLKIHLRKHTGERRHVCTICGVSFNRNAHLKRHSMTHTGERPFACDICAKSFFAKRDMVEHRRIHTGEKPFECDSCGQSFRVKRRLNLHLESHITTQKRPKIP